MGVPGVSHAIGGNPFPGVLPPCRVKLSTVGDKALTRLRQVVQKHPGGSALHPTRPDMPGASMREFKEKVFQLPAVRADLQLQRH